MGKQELILKHHPDVPLMDRQEIQAPLSQKDLSLHGIKPREPSQETALSETARSRNHEPLSGLHPDLGGS